MENKVLLTIHRKKKDLFLSPYVAKNWTSGREVHEKPSTIVIFFNSRRFFVGPHWLASAAALQFLLLPALLHPLYRRYPAAKTTSDRADRERETEREIDGPQSTWFVANGHEKSWLSPQFCSTAVPAALLCIHSERRLLRLNVRFSEPRDFNIFRTGIFLVAQCFGRSSLWTPHKNNLWNSH